MSHRRLGGQSREDLQLNDRPLDGHRKDGRPEGCEETVGSPLCRARPRARCGRGGRHRHPGCVRRDSCRWRVVGGLGPKAGPRDVVQRPRLRGSSRVRSAARWRQQTRPNATDPVTPRPAAGRPLPLPSWPDPAPRLPPPSAPGGRRGAPDLRVRSPGPGALPSRRTVGRKRRSDPETGRPPARPPRPLRSPRDGRRPACATLAERDVLRCAVRPGKPGGQDVVGVWPRSSAARMRFDGRPGRRAEVRFEPAPRLSRASTCHRARPTDWALFGGRICRWFGRSHGSSTLLPSPRTAEHGVNRKYDRRQKEAPRSSADDRGALRKIPAATYSPRGIPPKYHRRGRA